MRNPVILEVDARALQAHGGRGGVVARRDGCARDALLRDQRQRLPVPGAPVVGRTRGTMLEQRTFCISAKA